MEKSWSFSDKLAVALACLAGVMAIVLFWIDKTPLAAGLSIAAMAGFMVYPILHFVRSALARIPVFVATLLLIGMFGWKVWPHQIPPPANVSTSIVPPAPPPPTMVEAADHKKKMDVPVTVKQKGNENIGTVQQHDCGVVQIGGTGNIAAPVCAPPDRHLSPVQVSALRNELRSISGIRVSIWSENPTPEMRGYEQDWFDMCMQINMGWTCQQPSVGLGAPTPKGMVIQVPKEDDPLGKRLRLILKDAGIDARVEASAYLDEYNARIVIGSQ